MRSSFESQCKLVWGAFWQAAATLKNSPAHISALSCDPKLVAFDDDAFETKASKTTKEENGRRDKAPTGLCGFKDKGALAIGHLICVGLKS